MFISDPKLIAGTIAVYIFSESSACRRSAFELVVFLKNSFFQCENSTSYKTTNYALAHRRNSNYTDRATLVNIVLLDIHIDKLQSNGSRIIVTIGRMLTLTH